MTSPHDTPGLIPLYPEPHRPKVQDIKLGTAVDVLIHLIKTFYPELDPVLEAEGSTVIGLVTGDSINVYRAKWKDTILYNYSGMPNGYQLVFDGHKGYAVFATTDWWEFTKTLDHRSRKVKLTAALNEVGFG